MKVDTFWISFWLFSIYLQLMIITLVMTGVFE